MSFPTKAFYSSQYPLYEGFPFNPTCRPLGAFMQQCGRGPRFLGIYATNLMDANQKTNNGYQNIVFATMSTDDRHNYKTLPSSSGANIILVNTPKAIGQGLPIAQGLPMGGRKTKSYRKRTSRKLKKNKRKTHKKH